MNDLTCCFTGHRKIPPGEVERLRGWLDEEIRKLIHQGIWYYGTGGALGFDTLAAQAVLRLREEFPEVRLILVLPCPEQTRGWKQEDVAVYEDIKARSDKTVYMSEKYTRGCLFARNRHLVDNSGHCIGYFTESKSGTAYTMGYAKSKGLKVINLAPEV